MLGQTSEVKKVILQNKYGIKLNNLQLNIKNNLSNIELQLSKTEYPFIPSESLIFDKEYQPNEEEIFYVRLESRVSMRSVAGKMVINAKCNLIE